MTPATCHPDRKHKGHGLCNACYQRNRYHTNPVAHQYHLDKRREWAIKNPDKNRARALRFYYANQEHVKAKRRERHANKSHSERRAANLARYGMTLSGFDALLARQGNRCAICGTPAPIYVVTQNKQFAVDHNHQTGQTRGLLCQNCNRGLGLLKDNRTILVQAIRYLDEHSEDEKQ